MKPQVRIIVKGLLEKCSEKERNKLYNYLSEDELTKLDKTFPPSYEIDEKNFFHDGLIDTIHYSWFIPVLKIYPDKESSLFLLSMSPSYQEHLSKLLNINAQKIQLSKLAIGYFREILQQAILDKEESLLPIEYLPSSKLNILLTLSKKQLILLIDYLSMYDLALELKHIVETKTLKKIYSFLSEDEKSFLQKIIKHNPFYPSSRMKLEHADISEKKFKTYLHKYGINRLSKALSGESMDLLWYICHYLDIGRGTALFKACAKDKISGVSEIITSHILQICKMIKTKD